MSKNRKIVNLLAAGAIIISTVGFIVDVRSTFTYPGTDLRNRVVGTRLMLENIDPYIFKWQPGLSEKFYDPLDVPTGLVSKLSVPPTVLTLHAAIAKLPYIQQEVIWLLVQWTALVGTVLIFLKTCHSRHKAHLILGISFFLPIVCFGAFM